MYRPSTASATAPAQPATAARPARVPSIPAPKWAIARRREHPRLGLVEDLAAEQRGVLLLDRRAVHRRDEVRVATPAEHREGHPPDVARRGRVGRVEVAVGVEPGDREAGRRSGRAQTGHRPGVRRAVATEEQRARASARRHRRQRAAMRSRSRGRNAQIAARFLARGSGSGMNPGSMARSPASRTRPRPGPVAPASAATRPSARNPAGVRLHPGQVATQRGRDTDDDDRSDHGRHGAP